MKKNLFFALLTTALVISCNDDDSNSPSNSVVGVWKPSVQKIYSGTNNSTVLASANADNCFKQSTFDFKSNGTVTVNILETGSGTTCYSVGAETSNYAYDSNTKILTVDGDQLPVKVLTTNTFEIEDVDYQEDYNNDGVIDRMYITLVR